MKRTVLWISLLCLLLTFGLSRRAINSTYFTGIWYSADGRVYRFQEGIIERLQPESDRTLDGAYSFSRDSITLFVTDQDGLNTVTTLNRIPHKDGDMLSDEKGRVCFSRSQSIK